MLEDLFLSHQMGLSAETTGDVMYLHTEVESGSSEGRTSINNSWLENDAVFPDDYCTEILMVSVVWDPWSSLPISLLVI